MKIVTGLVAGTVFGAVGLLALDQALAGTAAPGVAQGAAAAPTDNTTSTAPRQVDPAATTTTTTRPTSTTTTTAAHAPSEEQPPTAAPRHIVPASEVAPDAKQLAVDVATALTTYETNDDHGVRLAAIGAQSGVEPLIRSADPLIHPGSWSRGEIVYAQLGGLTGDKASVMVVIRQTIGSGPDPDLSVVRTLDVRLARDPSGWAFDHLSSAGGDFEDVDDLVPAHAVSGDPRIQMSDSARLDIRNGEVSPVLLRLMLDLADQVSYGVVVAGTGHPEHVFETDRVSDHTRGRAIDIYLVGDRLVVADRGPGSTTRRIVEWLFEHPDVTQVGSPWDLDGEPSRRSFENEVHRDHIHVAVRDGS